MLHGWHSLYSSFSANEQEIFNGSVHLSKNPLCYYIAEEMVKACLTILDTVTIWYTVCEFIGKSEDEYDEYWIKDKGKHEGHYIFQLFSSFVHVGLQWIRIWKPKLDECYPFGPHSYHLFENHHEWWSQTVTLLIAGLSTFVPQWIAWLFPDSGVSR